jgi:hypothetical protein
MQLKELARRSALGHYADPHPAENTQGKVRTWGNSRWKSTITIARGLARQYEQPHCQRLTSSIPMMSQAVGGQMANETPHETSP